MEEEQDDEMKSTLLAEAKTNSERNANAKEDVVQGQQEGAVANPTIAIVIYGLNKYASGKELESFLKKKQQSGVIDNAFTYKKLKKPPGTASATMSFDKIEDQELAMNVLKGMEFKNNVLRCELKHSNRHGGKRGRDQTKDCVHGEMKRTKKGGDDTERHGTAPRSAKSAVAPW